MLAWAEGKEIQCKSISQVYGGSWWDLTNPSPSWDWGCYTYRIKPNTIKYRRWIMRGTNATQVCIAMDESGVKFANSHIYFIRWIDNDWIEEEL